jgi:hypothetical protein
MEKKELHSMARHRGLFLALGLAALIGLMAREGRAETLTLSVYAGTATTGTPIYTVTGGVNAVTANVGVLNTDLAGAGFAAYSFTSLGGSSNQPGSTTAGVGGFVQTTGSMSVAHGLSGESTPITIVLTEGGFTLPPAAPTLSDTATGNMGGLTSSSQTDSGQFTDSSTPTPKTVNTPSNVLTSSGIATTSATLGAYVVPFTLNSVTTLSLDAASSTLPGSDGFSNRVFVASSVPEPASIVMMLTGMPLPLVVLGLLRRRRRAAA